MTDTKKIYLVTNGAYSDYSVEGVFSTREKAEVYAERYNRTYKYAGTEIEEYDLDPEHPIPRLAYSVNVYSNPGDEPKITPRKEAYTIEQTNIHYLPHLGYRGMAYADTPEQALKIAYDEVAKIKAERLEAGSEWRRGANGDD